MYEPNLKNRMNHLECVKYIELFHYHNVRDRNEIKEALQNSYFISTNSWKPIRFYFISSQNMLGETSDPEEWFRHLTEEQKIKALFYADEWNK